MNDIPIEFTVGGVYLPPLLVAGCLGTLLAYWTTHLLNRYRLSRYFFYPPLVFVALAALYTVVVGYLLIPF
ncbi:MAG: DUF1656 domain-containing protein [Desulfobacterales bacterium]|jgi:hypothetical protein